VFQRGSRGGPALISRTSKCTNNTSHLLKIRVHVSWKNYKAKGQHTYGLIQIVVSKVANHILGSLFCFLSLPQREVIEVRWTKVTVNWRLLLTDSNQCQYLSTSSSNPVFKTSTNRHFFLFYRICPSLFFFPDTPKTTTKIQKPSQVFLKHLPDNNFIYELSYEVFLNW